MMKHITTIILAALSTVTVSTASAASFATASLSNFTYSLVDLDLSDGITPELIWYDNTWSRVNGEATSFHPTNPNLDTIDYLYGFGGSLQEFASTTTSYASAVGGTNNGLNSLNFQANGFATNGYYLSDLEGWGNFLVLGKAQVTISATASLSALNGNAYVNLRPYDRGGFSNTLDFGNGDSFSLSASDNAIIGLPNVKSENKVFTFNFDSTNPYMNGSIYLNLGVNGGSGIQAPVPEPETYAMLLAGLGLVGFSARRKKS